MTDMRVCSICGDKKPIDDFPFANKQTGQRRRDCKLCFNSANRRKWQTKRHGTRLDLDENPPVSTSAPLLIEQEKEELWFVLRYQDGKKKCSHCSQFKNTDEFFRDTDTRDGYTARCKECYSPNRAEDDRQRHLGKPWLRTLQNSKTRAKKLGISHTLTEEYIRTLYEQDDGICPVLHIPMQVGGNLQYVPSLDRIKPEFGYVPGNVRLISYRANSLKSDATVEELRLVYEDALHLQ